MRAPVVLVAYDGSPAGRRASVHAADIVGRSATVTVVNVVPTQAVGSRLQTVTDGRSGDGSETCCRKRSPCSRATASTPTRSPPRQPVRRDPRGRRPHRRANPRRRSRSPLASHAQPVARDPARLSRSTRRARRRLDESRYQADQPPSTTTFEPVTYDDASAARKTTAPSASCASAIRPSGTRGS